MATTTAPPLVRLGTRPRVLDYIRSLWARREFAIAIPRAELQSQHRNTVLGGLWHLLDPLLLVAIYYVVFGLLMPGDRGTGNLVGYLAIGVFVWQFTTKAVRVGAKSVISNEGLVRAIAFPRAILPISTVIAEFVAYGYALIVMFSIVLLTGEEPGWTWLLIVPLSVIQLLFNAGLAMFFARVADHFRDIVQVIPYALRILGYLSGLLFPIEGQLAKYPALKIAMDWNPGYLILRAPRQAIMDNAVPAARDWAVLLLWAIGALVLGFVFFLAREHEYGRG